MARILLVEDQQDVRLLLQHVLLGSGYEVDVTETVAQARLRLDAASYGIAIADAAKERGMKTLIVTGYAFQDDTHDLLRHEYLLKPVSPSELLLTIRRLVGEP